MIPGGVPSALKRVSMGDNMSKIRTIKIIEYTGRIEMWQVHKDYPGIERLLILGENSVTAPSFEELYVNRERVPHAIRN